MKKDVTAKSPQVKPVATDDNLRLDLAIGTITLFSAILVLYLINYFICNNYHPDTETVLDNLLPLTIVPREWFAPEPVERLQFQVSLLSAPFIVFGLQMWFSRLSGYFKKNPQKALAVNIAGLVLLFICMFIVSVQKLVNIPDQTTAYFFINNFVSLANPVLVILVYALTVYLFYLYNKSPETALRKKIVTIVSWLFAAIIIIDIVWYNILHLALMGPDNTGEINAVFYCITQVYAGKALLVDFNTQYGLFAWFLRPVFSIIGMSVYNIGLVMSLLNGCSFLFLFLGINKVVKKRLLALLIFLCLVFWQYWLTRVPVGGEPRNYYQYWPVRMLFPSLVFFLVTAYQAATAQTKKIILPMLTLSSSFAVLWNLDTGIVVYVAALVFLLISTVDLPKSAMLKKSLTYLAWMFASLFLALLTFFLSTKLHSGQWPDIRQITKFQKLFYGSGFYMLPMGAIHLWNFTAMTYLVACIYCVANLKKKYPQDMPVVAFLFILGAGIFAFFQGRSFDLSLMAAMYPQIIIMGICCNKLIDIIMSNNYKLHEGTVVLLILFIFLADGALSMAWHAPRIHSYVSNITDSIDEGKENELAAKISFIQTNVPKNDTVLIIAKNYESFYYAAGGYNNPLNVPGSTEMVFKSELYALLDLIRTTKYPIVFEPYHWLYADTVTKTLGRYTKVKKELAGTEIILLTKREQPKADKLVPGPNTIYYSPYGLFNKYVDRVSDLDLKDDFTIEMIVKLDTAKLASKNVMFCNTPQDEPFTGIVMIQRGGDLSNYVFLYGDGTRWCASSPCKLSCKDDNHVVIKVRKNIITVFNNDIPCGEADTKSALKRNHRMFLVNPSFAGSVDEIKISNE
jgi:hypothetical protein